MISFQIKIFSGPITGFCLSVQSRPLRVLSCISVHSFELVVTICLSVVQLIGPNATVEPVRGGGSICSAQVPICFLQIIISTCDLN